MPAAVGIANPNPTQRRVATVLLGLKDGKFTSAVALIPKTNRSKASVHRAIAVFDSHHWIEFGPRYTPKREGKQGGMTGGTIRLTPSGRKRALKMAIEES